MAANLKIQILQPKSAPISKMRMIREAGSIEPGTIAIFPVPIKINRMSEFFSANRAEYASWAKRVLSRNTAVAWIFTDGKTKNPNYSVHVAANEDGLGYRSTLGKNGNADTHSVIVEIMGLKTSITNRSQNGNSFCDGDICISMGRLDAPLQLGESSRNGGAKVAISFMPNNNNAYISYMDLGIVSVAQGNATAIHLCGNYVEIATLLV